MLIRPIILCGGSGTRLWPESRKSNPKQFISIFNGKSLFDFTLERVLSFDSPFKPIIICNKDYGFYVKNSLKNYSLDAHIIFEPEGKNTTAAIYLATKICDKKDNVIIMPSDHFIPDINQFQKDVKFIIKNADFNHWITLGVSPKIPSEAFGYIKVKDSKLDKFLDVLEFKEKPSSNVAKKYIKTKNYYWNAGIFLGNVSMILKSIHEYAYEVAAKCEIVFANKRSNNITETNFCPKLFSKIPSISIDFSVMEHANNIKLFPINCDWSDIGNWDSFFENIKKSKKNKNLIQIDSNNNFIRNDGRIIATIGVEDLIIVNSDNATLIAKKTHSEKVKLIVEKLNEEGFSEGNEHTFEYRPWGKFENLLISDYCKVKKIIVNSKERLSLQYHNYRSEHWLVVSGVASVYLDGKDIILNQGMSIDIPKKSQHYIHNNTLKELIIIETQLGEYFGEDDIIRLDDPYKR